MKLTSIQEANPSQAYIPKSTSYLPTYTHVIGSRASDRSARASVLGLMHLSKTPCKPLGIAHRLHNWWKRGMAAW